MNQKTAKILRKLAGFHPTKTERKYVPLQIQVDDGQDVKIKKIETTQVNAIGTPRYKYQQLKKEYK